MRLLYIIQQSIYDNNGKWSSADSNIGMFIGLARELVEKTDWEIHALIAPTQDFSDISNYRELFNHPNVMFKSWDYPVDAFLNRQNFPARDMEDLIKLDYDLIINNITEISRNIRSIIEINKLKTKLITQCFWLDCPEIGEAKVPTNMSYDWRQFDGFECSDWATFTCNSTKEAFIENSKHKFVDKYIQSVLNKSSVWDFGYSKKEADEYYSTPIDKVPNPRILFLNRLSGINYSHHEEFFEVIRDIWKERQDFEVVFTNPSRKISFEEIAEKCPAYVPYKDNKPLNRREYWNLLYSGDMSVHLFTIERYSGCALRESIAAGNIPIVAQCYEQERIVNTSQFMVNIGAFHDIDKKSLKRAILNGMDSCFWGTGADGFDFTGMAATIKGIRERNEESSFEHTAKIVIEDINRVLESK
jgi:hypothetical protein